MYSENRDFATGAAAQGVLPPGTVTNTLAGFDTSTPAVATPAPVVGQPEPKAKEFPTLRLSESSDLLPSFRLSSSSSSPTLPWGTAEDSSPSFSPNRVREGHSQNVPGEGSLLNVSLLSPGLVVRPTREGGAAPSEGVLLPTMLEDFDDSVLGDPISFARFEQLPGSESPLSLPVYAWPPSSAFLMDSAVIRTVLAPRKSERLAAGTSVADPPVMAGEDSLLETGLPGCPYRLLESGQLPFTDENPAWLTATSSSLSGVSGSSGVIIILNRTLGQRTGNGGGHQFTTGRGCYIVESTNTVPVCYGNEQDVIFDDGLGPRTIVVSESGGR